MLWTFDLSILEIGNGVFEVKSTNGDTFLGGDDIDAKVVTYLAESFRNEHGVDLRKDEIALQRLKEAAEKAKCELSYSIKTNINLPFITTDAGNHKHLNTSLTRAQLEQTAQDLIDRTIEHCKIALKDASFTPDDIDEVILVGGQTRMPLVQERVRKFLGKEAHKNVNPDEVVAVGAAIQGGILKGEIHDVVLVDVTPLSLGIETLGGIFIKIINKNSTIPTEKSQMFTTAVDNQASVSIHVLQGERDMTINNKSLGRFDLVGIPPAPKNKPQIEVIFSIDANGIVNVSAEDIKTGMEQSIRVNPSSGLTEGEIQQMVKDAKFHVEEDRKNKKLAQLRNEADSFITQTEKWLSECEKELSDLDEERVKETLTKLKSVRADDNPIVIDSAIDELSELMDQIDSQVKI